MTTNAVVLPPSTHSEAHLVQDLHNDLTKKRTAYEWYRVFIHIIYMYISWHRLSSYGTQAPHKWSMVMTCYNSVYRGCHPTVARLFIRPFIGAPFYPLQELTLQELIPAKQATSHKKCPSWFPKSPLGKSPNTGLGWDSLQKKVKLYNNNPYGD